MFEKDLHLAYLLDFYGDVLQEKIRRVMEAYFNEDLSLAEIASGEGVSRQAIRHLIKRGEEQLRSLELSLGLAAHYTQLTEAAARLEQAANCCQDSNHTDVSALVQEALASARLMRNQ